MVLNENEKEFLVEQFRDMLDYGNSTRVLEIANLDNKELVDGMQFPADFPVIRRRKILITVDEIVPEE